MKVTIDRPFNILVAGNYPVNKEDMLIIQCLANTVLLDYALNKSVNYYINNDALYSCLVHRCLACGWTWDDIKAAIAWYTWDGVDLSNQDIDTLVKELQGYVR